MSTSDVSVDSTNLGDFLLVFILGGTSLTWMVVRINAELSLLLPPDQVPLGKRCNTPAHGRPVQRSSNRTYPGIRAE